MKRLRNTISLSLAFLCLPFTAGCTRLTNPRELEQLQLVQTVGYDGAPGSVTISVSSGQGLNGEPPSLLAANGGSITGAMRKLQDWSAREQLYFAHVRYAVAGEDAARAGVEPLLDHFERGTQTPLNLPLLVVKGGSARELVTGSADPMYEVTALLASLQRDTQQMGTAYCFTVLDVAQRLARSRAALCCAVTAEPAGENVPSAEDGALAAMEAGYAVLKEGKLVGYLDRDTALGTDLVMNLAGEALYILTDGHGGTVTVELRDGATSLAPEWDAHRNLTVAVKLNYKAGIVDASGDLPMDEEFLARLDDTLALAMTRQVEAALRDSRDMNADFMELYRQLAKKAPGAFPGTVPDDFLTTLRWRVEARATVERSYDIDGSANGEEESRHG